MDEQTWRGRGGRGSASNASPERWSIDVIHHEKGVERRTRHKAVPE